MLVVMARFALASLVASGGTYLPPKAFVTSSHRSLIFFVRFMRGVLCPGRPRVHARTRLQCEIAGAITPRKLDFFRRTADGPEWRQVGGAGLSQERAKKRILLVENKVGPVTRGGP